MDYIVTLLFQDPGVLCKQISTPVLIGSASIAEIIRIFDVQNQKLIDLRLGQTCLFYSSCKELYASWLGPKP